MIVQTLWTNNKSLLDSNFGWTSPKYHLLSWILSVCLLSKHYKKITLYTDNEGKSILIDKLKLPYTDVKVCYNDLNISHRHWALPKVMTYNKMTEPFMHVDGDVYLFDKVDYEDKEIVIQNKESNGVILTKYINKYCYPRVIMDSDILYDNPIKEYNCGVFGGNDLNFIKNYCNKAFKIVKDNKWDATNTHEERTQDNLIFELILLYDLAKDKKVYCAYTDEDIEDYTKSDIAEFNKFTHLLALFKGNDKYFTQLEKIVLEQYPEYYNRLMGLLKDNL